MKKNLLIMFLVIFIFAGNICFAHSKDEVLFFSGIDTVTKQAGLRNLDWYVRTDSIKISDDKVRCGALCFAHDENDKWVWTEQVIFSIVRKKTDSTKYRVVREINGYEMGNFTKDYAFLKKNTFYYALKEFMKKYIDFESMVPIGKYK